MVQDLSEFDDLRLGDGKRLDAILQSLPTVLSAIKKGLPIRQLGEPVFYEPLAVAVDKGDDEFNKQVSDIIKELRKDGTLKSGTASTILRQTNVLCLVVRLA